MNKLDAFDNASKIANGDRIVMVVTHNPYEEFETHENSYGYMPESSYVHAMHESVIAKVFPEG
jgi:hypothetical protein